ncbi:MAG: CARDB domain-containing protein [Cyanobacteria bacterium J06558_2]
MIDYSGSLSRNYSLAPDSSYYSRADLEIPDETIPGNYYLLFYADKRDYQGETDESDNVTALPIEVFDTTNIEISDVDTPSSAILDDKVTVSWTVSNTGLSDASATWYDYIYLSEDEVYDSNDAYAGSYRYEADTIINAGESFTATHEISISESLGTGDRYLLFIADHTGIFPENDETDNIYSVPISLDVTNLELTDAPNVPTSVSIYETLDLSWIVTNTGTGRASSYWFDEIYLSEDENYDNSDEKIGSSYHNADTPLNSGASYEATETVNIPNSSWLGNQYILFITDEDDYQAESDETDNVLALPIEIKAANLVVTDVVHSQSITTSGIVSTSLTVSNVGDVNLLNQGRFITNTVYLSDDEIFDLSDRDLGTSYTYITDMAVNESYTAKIDATIPHDAKGSKYLIFAIDDDQDLIESNNNDNYYTVPIEIITPNLTLSDSISPDWAGVGQTIPISWTVTNNSEVQTVPWSYEDDNTYWDRIYLSSDPLWDNDDTLVDEKLIDLEAPLAPGDSYTVSQEITLPNGQEGEQYLLFVTDTNNRQGETDETDNVRTVPIVITNNGVNLQLTEANAPATAILGETIAVDWSTVNVGGISASLDWLDRVYLSDDTTLDNTDFRLNEQATGSLSPLAPGNSYGIGKNVTIPLQGAGTRYLIFKADDENDQIETDDNDNTYVLPIELLAPNLTVTSPVAPNAAFLGESIDLTWTIANIGIVDAFGSRQETVYISDDQYLDIYDEPLSYNYNSSLLKPGTESTTDKNAEIPRTTIGDRYLLFVADSNNVQGETDETDNLIALPIKLTALDIDLVVSDISAPLESFAGEEVEVVWTVTNNGSEDATGTWSDGIYLISDTSNIQAKENYFSYEFTGTVAAGQSIERRQKITLPQTLEGDFKIVVQTDVNDSLIEYGKEDNNLRVREASFTSILPTFANLQVSQVIAPVTAFSSQSTVVEWTVTNVGDAATSAPLWEDKVWLSLDQNYDNNDIELGQAFNTSYLNPGDSYTNSLEVALPQDIEGKYYFLVQTDWGGSQVFEFQNENDNLGISNISDIELTPPPDLKVRVNAPSNAFSGELTGVSWTVTNEGQGRTLQSSWYDEVYLSTDTKLDSSDEYLGRQNHSGVLEPGESYTVNEFYRLFKLPEGVSGDYYFIVRTDAGSQVFESVLSSNNTGFDETVTQVFLTPPPDIEISLDAPDTGLASNEIILYYSSSNYGATPVTRGSWSNNFYLSEDEQFDSGSDILLGSRSSYETYGAGSSYLNKSIVVQLPDGLSGDYYIFAQADGENRVFELDKDNNVAFDTITIDSQPADLIVSEVTANDVVEAGTAAKISWTTINQGTGSTFETRWNDEIWLSADSIIGNGNDYLLGTFSHNGLLKPGESYSKSELITIPFYFQGDYQLYVKTDADDSVYEDNIEINNILNSSQITITRQTPDLQVNSVNAGISGISGESFFVEWTVINSGTGETNSNYWYDEVFLSLDQNINDKSDISLGKVYHSGSLEANESYKVGQTFELPQNLDRDYYVVVKTDVGDQVLETPLENNNETASSTTTSISLNAVPDLVFDFIDAPAQGISGQTFELSWKVSNQGADTSSGWTEVFYLSQDQVLDRDNDIYLGSSFNEEGLAAGAESSQTALFNISAGLSGPLYVFGVVDSLNSIFERGGEDNNIAYDGNSMNVILPDPADLTVGAVSVPNDGVPGQNITIDYTVSNQGDFTVNGNWEDAIYLSEDDQWDINDPLIEKVRVFDSVESGESYSRTVEAELPGVATGNYYVVARSDIRNHVYESDDDNNLAVSATQITVNPELLELGGSDTDTIRPGKSIYYRLEVSAGQAIRIKLDSQDNSSSNNVYVRYEQMPTKGQFDFFTEPFSADPEIVFPAEQDGTYYVLVTGDDSSAANDFTITAEEIPFSLLDVSTKQVGNVSPFTLEIEGAKFDADNTAFQIVDGSGTIYEATQVVFKNSTTAYATFDLSGQSIGNYDVRAIKNDGTSVVLEDILMVEEGIDAELFSSIEGPEVVRIWGKYFAKLNYANLGGADEAAPLIILQTPDTSLGLSADSIAPTESLFLLGVGEDLGADVLRAGEINQIPFFYAPGTSVNVSMLRYTEDSNTRINDSDWNTIETAIKPAAVVDEDWNKFWSTVQPRIGNTWGDYVQVVNDLAKAFSPEAERDYDVRELFAEWYESGDLSVYTPKSFVSGSLIDTETGEPLSNVELQLYQEIDGETIQNFNKVITNSDGAFAFSTLPPGNYKLAVANDYALVKSLSQNANSFESSYTFDISLGNDISNMELEVDLSPQTNEIEIQDDQLYQDFDFTQLLNDFEDWAQEENNSSSTLLNPAANTLSETSNIFPQNENDNLIENIEDRINIPTQVFNLPVIGEIKLKRQVVQEKTEDIRVIKGQNTLKQVAKLQEKSEIRFSGLEERLGISLPKIRYTADGKLTTKKEEEDCEWIDKEYKLEVGGSALEIKAEFETANSIITLLIPEPLRSAVVDFVVNGGDLFTTLSANWLSYSREWTRNAETGELSIKDKWKPSFAIEQFIGKQFGDFRYGLYTKFQIEPEITPFEDTKLNKFTASGEFYLALPVAGVFGYKLKLINDKDGFTTQYIRIDGNSIEIPAIEVPGDSPIPLPPGDDNPSLPSGFSALELIQSPESFFDFPEPPEIGHCDDEHEEDNGDLGDYNPAVLTSSDPNDILGPDGFGEEKWIDAEKTLDYTIRFENDPELATAPAQVVKITQQLDEDLDFRTFRLGDFGFGDTFIDVPDNRAFYQTRLDLVAEKGIYLDFFAGIDIATGEAFWELHSIDPATGEQPNNPLLGFLPPNLTKPEGDGFVSYSIRADRDIETGAVIDAEATIIFDVNEPIDTPPIFNTIDALKPSSTVEALPDLSDTKEFTVSWTGNDDPNGSAIADYTIYVAENSGEFTPWLENTTLTEALFTGTPGSSYQFYAVARDNAGNVEDIPNTPQAQTTIAGGNNPPLLLNPIDDLMIAENSNFSFTISDNVFFDSDEGDVLNFSAALADGTSLPLWLNFDGANQTFTGTPSSEDVRIYEIEVTATDSSNETATDLFTLEVEEVVEQAVFSTIGEFGQVSNFNHLRQTIEFNHSYDNPVVFALPLSRHGGDPATVRITNLESDRFTAYLQEPEYKDGWHVTENFSYLVLEAGDWVLEDGTLLEVGTVDTRKLTTQGWENLDFDLDFESTPAILSQVQTYNGNQFVRTRQRRASVDGFLLSMEEEEALKYSGHLTETVGWLAIETGTGVLGELEYQAGHTDD